MVHGRGYRVFSSSYCCNCSRKKNIRKKSTTTNPNREISSPCYTAAVPLPVMEKGDNKIPKDPPTQKHSFDSLPILTHGPVAGKDLDENDNKKSPDEIWKKMVNQHDHERMEKEVKKLEERIRNLGKVHSSDNNSQTSNKCHKYSTISHMDNSRPKCTFL